MRFWLTAAGCSLAFVLAGVFFATRQSLGEADQYASVGSFLLALATLGGTAIVAARRRGPASPPEPGAAGSRFRIGTIKDVGQLTVGDHSTTHVTNYHADDGAEKPRRSPRRGPT